MADEMNSQVTLAILSAKMDMLIEHRKSDANLMEKRMDLISTELRFVRECWQTEHDRVQVGLGKIEHLPDIERRMGEMEKRERWLTALAAGLGILGAGLWKMLP